jgi:signal peptidase I
MSAKRKRIWVVFAALVGCGQSAAVEKSTIQPEGHAQMAPTIQPGEVVKLREGSFGASKAPARGTIVLMQHPKYPVKMIFRVAGTPGDTVEIKAGRLWLNGQQVERTQAAERMQEGSGAAQAIGYREQFPGEASPHLIKEISDTEQLDDTPTFKVPPDHVFLLGDNRDNSADSRAPTGHRSQMASEPHLWPRARMNPADADGIGFVPLSKLLGEISSGGDANKHD